MEGHSKSNASNSLLQIHCQSHPTLKEKQDEDITETKVIDTLITVNRPGKYCSIKKWP